MRRVLAKVASISLLLIGLPEMDGVTVLEKWRDVGRKMPVLILTARDRWSDKVAGIDAGADDYVTKPFHMEEVQARLRALIRRAAGHASSELSCGPVRLDTKSSKVTVDGKTLKGWDANPKITVGDEVFAIGNPHSLGWTYTPGGISQMRLQTKGPLEVRVIQTSAAINPGNSGGGLYDREGRLVGINTWTKDKRFAEGLSFSIAFHTLLPLLPAEYRLPDHQFEVISP